MNKPTKYDQLLQEWEALDSKISQTSGFSDVQLEELYEQASRMPSVKRPALPAAHRQPPIPLYLAAIVLLLVLPVPHADALLTPNDNATNVKSVNDILVNMAEL